MLRASLLLCALVLVEALQDHSGFSQGYFAIFAAQPAYPQSPSPADCKATCEKIERSISSASQVFYRGQFRVICLDVASPIDSDSLDSKEFDLDISHWVESSTQVPVCTVEPGTSNDVGLIVRSVLLPTHSRLSR